ncbi:MAG: hypothetical protein ACLVES_05775 [Faecalibacterium prausnitzii]
MKVLRSTDKWYGVTYTEDKPVVVNAIAQKDRGWAVPGRPAGYKSEHTLCIKYGWAAGRSHTLHLHWGPESY